MKKEYISYGVVGLVLGLIFGFITANWTSTSSSSAPQVASAPQAPASVNSSSENQDLPPGHPPITGAQPMQAPPLPAGAAGSGAGSTAEGESVELPSLDPLPASNREERTEQKYKNIQVLKGLPAERLQDIMFAFRAALGVDCTYCHIKDQFEKDDKSAKQTARKMITLTRNANNQLGGSARVTCYTCHRGQTQPPA